MRPVLIALVALLLLYQTSKGQDYSPYIGLHVKGDIIALDSAVVMDLYFYRSIRNYNLTSDELVASKISIIHALEEQVTLGDSIVQSQRSQLEMTKYTIVRKDELISGLNGSFQELDSLSNYSIELLKESLNKRNPILTDERLWMGVGIGFIVGVLLVN